MNRLTKGVGLFFLLIFITAPVLAQETVNPVFSVRPEFSAPSIPDFNKLSWISEWNPISMVQTLSNGLSNTFFGMGTSLLRFPKEWVKRIPEDNPLRAEEKLEGNLRDSLVQSSSEEVRVNVIVFSDYLNDAAQHVQTKGALLENSFPIGNILSIRIPGDKLLDVAQLPEVKSIWPDRVFHTNLDSSVPQIHAQDMWTAGYTGAGVKVAVLDTGIDSTHPMLQGRVPVSQSFTGEPAADVIGHGTHVAGIVGGKLNGANTYNGVAPDSTLWNIKVLDNTGHGAESWIIAGINYAVDPDNNPSTDDGADILNLSFGGPYTDPNSPIVSAIEDAISRGVVVVIASGNCGPGCPSSDCQGFIGVETPGDAPNAITVGAVDDASQWACFSSGGFVNNGQTLKPDVVAPGVDISSSSLNGALATLSGTSMAAPHVSGMAALLLQSNPSLSTQNVKDILEQTASDFGDVGKDSKYGSGLIDGSQLLPSSVLTFLKYSLSQSVNVIDTGNPISFTITSASSDVYDISLTVTRPNQLVDAILLNQNGLQWSGNYSSTQLAGNYLVTATIENIAHDVTVLHKTFSVKAPSTTGLLLGHNLPAQANHGQPIVVNAQFQNTGAFDTNVLVELQEWKDDYFERIYFSNIVPVSAGQTVSIPANWVPQSTLGNKTIKLIATFDDTALELDQNVFVEDPDAPVLWNVSHSSTSTDAQPIIVDVRAGDLTALSGIIHITSPAIQDIPLFTRFDSDFNRTLRGIIETIQPGNYSFTIEVCDSATIPHCVSSVPQSVNVSTCNAPKSLIILGAGSPSDFNFLSPAQYCLGFWEDFQQTPSSSFLNSFPLIYWNAGSSYSAVPDDNASSLLLAYTGNLVLEGDDIASRHGNDLLMENLANASFVDELFIDTNTTTPFSVSRPHSIFQNISSPIPLQPGVLFFTPDNVSPMNGGISLAGWDGNGSSIVAYQSNSLKHLFLSFNTKALVPSARQSLIQNIFTWMNTTNGPDAQVLGTPLLYFPPFDFTPSSSTPPSGSGMQPAQPAPYPTTLMEGLNALPFFWRNSGNASAANVPFHVYVDGSLVQSLTIPNMGVNKSGQVSSSLSLTKGLHSLSSRINPLTSIFEPNSLNNDYNATIWVSPTLPNARPMYIDGNYSDANGTLTIKAYIANFGGTKLTNIPVRFSIDGTTSTLTLSLNPRQIGMMQQTLSTSKRNVPVTITVDPANIFTEDDESDNVLSKTLYFCTRQKVLVVNDDDAEIYWASDEDFDGNISDLNASSAPLFDHLLKENGYCSTIWNESKQGVPDLNVLAQYPLVVWSTGDYWSLVIDANDESVIRKYSGSLLFEGNDIAFDHRDDNLSYDILRVDMNHDVFSLSNAEQITLNSAIFPTLPLLDINFYYSSFADAVLPINNSFSAGEWSDATSALTLYSAPGTRTSFMGFSFDSINSSSDQNAFLVRLTEWLLLASNQPPSVPTNLLCNNATCSGNYSNSISLTCQGSVDPENDALTYHIETALPASSSNWFDPAWSHRIPIDINMSGAQANFRTSVDIDTSLITNPAFWSNIKSDFGDVRFVYNGALLKYYRPVFGDNTFASFWIEFDAVQGVNTIDMYFGNPSATYVGKNNPTEFFLTGPWHLVDDFDDGVLTNWTVRSGTWQEAGGILQRTGGASSEDQITKDWLQRGSSFYIRAQGRPTSSCVNTEIALTRDTSHAGPTYLDEYFGLSVDNACPAGYLYSRIDLDHSTGTLGSVGSNPLVMEDNKTEVLISRSGWTAAFIADAAATPFVKVPGWESMDHTFPYLSMANHGGPTSEADEIYTSNAPNHAYDVGLTFGNIQTPSSGGSISWQEIGTHAENASYIWNVSALGTHSNVGLRCRAIDYAGSGQYSPYYTVDQNISIN